MSTGVKSRLLLWQRRFVQYVIAGMDKPTAYKKARSTKIKATEKSVAEMASREWRLLKGRYANEAEFFSEFGVGSEKIITAICDALQAEKLQGSDEKNVPDHLVRLKAADLMRHLFGLGTENVRVESTGISPAEQAAIKSVVTEVLKADGNNTPER